MAKIGRILLALAIVQLPFVSFAKSGVCTELSFDSCHQTEEVVTPPKLFYAVAAEYPRKAEADRLEGLVVVRLIVDEKGKPELVTIVHSATEHLPAQHREAALQMDENAVKAVRKFRFFPAKLHGLPVMTDITIEVRLRKT